MFLLTVLSVFLNIVLMVTFILPLVLSIVIIPFGLYRLLIRILALIFRPDFVSMVPCRDAIFANDKFSTRPSSTIVAIITLEGDVEIDSIRRIAVKQIFGGNCSPSPKQKYAPLMQYFVNWGGFVFRKWEKNFDIGDHFIEWRKSSGGEDAVVTSEDIFELRRKLLNEPYKPGKSAWETVLVRNYQENEFQPKGTILLTKFHHGVADGYSIIKLFLATLANITDVKSVLPVPDTISKPLSLLQNFATFSKLFAQCLTTAQSQLLPMDPANIFHPNHSQTKSNFTGVRHPVSTSIPLKTVKNAAKQSGTSYTAVILGGLTGGVRNYLISKNKDVPKSIDLAIPLPWPGHDDNKVQNHFTYAMVDVPTGLPHHLDRLKNLHDQFVVLKRSSAPAFNYVLVALAGMLPNPVMIQALKCSPTSLILSSISGPNRPIRIFDRPTMTTPHFEGGYGKDQVGMGVSMFSYCEEVSISINPEMSVVPTKSDAEELLRCIVNEIQLIHDSTFV